MIQHEFIASDEGHATLLHVDERDQSKNWESRIRSRILSQINRNSGTRRAGRSDLQRDVGELFAIMDVKREMPRDLRCRWNMFLPEGQTFFPTSINAGS